MKKAIALLATLVVLTGTTFAQLAPTITASAETKWGVNLEADNASGFETDLDITVIVPLTTEGAQTDGAHSTIALTGVELSINVDDGDWEDNDAGDLAAKLLFGDAYVVIGDDAGTSFNFAESTMDYYDIQSDAEGYAGMTFGYSTDMYNFAVNVNSNLGYNEDNDDDGEITWNSSDLFAEVDDEFGVTDSAVNEDNLYNYGILVGITPMDIFNVDLGFSSITDLSYDIASDDDATSTTVNVAEYSRIAFGANVYGTIMEGVTYSIPVDYLSADISDEDYVTYELHPNMTAAVNNVTFGLGYYMLHLDKGLLSEPGTTTTGSGTGVYTAPIALADDLDIAKITTSVAYGTDMFNVALGVDINVTEDANAQDLDFTADVTPVAGIKFYTDLEYGMNGETDVPYFDVNSIGVQLTSELTGIENTVFTVEFGEFETTDGDTDNSGEFFVGAIITL